MDNIYYKVYINNKEDEQLTSNDPLKVYIRLLELLNNKFIRKIKNIKLTIKKINNYDIFTFNYSDVNVKYEIKIPTNIDAYKIMYAIKNNV